MSNEGGPVVARIVKTRRNWVYKLITETRHTLCRHSCAHLEPYARRMANVLEKSHQADDKLRASARAALPAAFSPSLVPRLEQAVDAHGEALREELYEIFSDELECAVERERARTAKRSI